MLSRKLQNNLWFVEIWCFITWPGNKLVLFFKHGYFKLDFYWSRMISSGVPGASLSCKIMPNITRRDFPALKWSVSNEMKRNELKRLFLKVLCFLLLESLYCVLKESYIKTLYHEHHQACWSGLHFQGKK